MLLTQRIALIVLSISKILNIVLLLNDLFFKNSSSVNIINAFLTDLQFWEVEAELSEGLGTLQIHGHTQT